MINIVIFLIGEQEKWVENNIGENMYLRIPKVDHNWCNYPFFP